MKKSSIKEVAEIIEEAMQFCELVPKAVELGKQDDALPKIRGFVDERILECVEFLNDERDSLQDKYDELSERAQEGAKGQDIQDEISDIDSAISSLQECMADPMRDILYLKDAAGVVKAL